MPTPPPPPPPSAPPSPVPQEHVFQLSDSESESDIEFFDYEGIKKFWSKLDGTDQLKFLEFVTLWYAINRNKRGVLQGVLQELGYVRAPDAPSYVTSAVQTEPQSNTTVISVAEAATQTTPPPLPKKTYAEVATPSTIDQMDLDPPTPSSQVTKTTPKKTPRKANTNKPPSPSKARALVVHNINTASPLSHTVRKVEMEIRRVAIGARWLLSGERCKGKKASSVVVFFYDNVPVPGVLNFGGQKHRVDEYEWGRVSKGMGRNGK